MGKRHGHGLQLLIAFACAFLALLLCYAFRFYFRRRAVPKGLSLEDAAADGGGAETEEGMIRFAGGEDLTARDILDAPGEVVAKSSHATLYRAVLRRGDSTALLRFVQPDSAARTEDVLPAVRRLGGVRRHPNLVPLTAMYLGPRGEKLLVHPFYAAGNLAQFIRGTDQSDNQSKIYSNSNFFLQIKIEENRSKFYIFSNLIEFIFTSRWCFRSSQLDHHLQTVLWHCQGP